jgi:hypothetical protein
VSKRLKQRATTGCVDQFTGRICKINNKRYIWLHNCCVNLDVIYTQFRDVTADYEIQIAGCWMDTPALKRMSLSGTEER